MEKNERIERYLLGELSPDERRHFEEELAKDPALAAELQLQGELMAAVRNDEAAAFRARLRKFRKPAAGVAGKAFFPRPSPVTLLLLAAAVALLLMVNYFFSNQPTSAAAVYAFAEQHGLPVFPNEFFPEAAARREAGQEVTGPFDLAVLEIQRQYQAGDYQEALAGLTALPADRIGTARFHFYRAVLEWRSGDEEAAMESFTEVDDDGILIDPARWNLALLLVKQGRTDEALAIFKKLAADNYQKEKGREMIRKLERLP